MGYRIPLAEDASFPLQIKNLADEELLDFWAETQQIEGLIRKNLQNVTPAFDYEQLIVFELQLRSCSRHVGSPV